MTAGELLSLFRSEMSDLEKPYLWADSEVYSYADDAQRMFCRFTDGIGDASTPAVVELAVTDALGAGFLDLHPSILKVRDVTRTDTGADVPVVNREDMLARGWRFDGRIGPVRALIVGEQDRKARVWPAPSEDVTLQLLVFRMPLQTITEDSEDVQMELSTEHHRHLLLWMKHLAYSKQDAETFDKTKAAEFETRFLTYCDASQAQQRRARHKPRAVAYGGL